MSEPSDILEEARGIIYGRREQDYGPPKVNFQRIATGWSIIFGCDVTPQQVALGMIWLKTARLVENPFDHDGRLDVVGYTLCLERLDE
jgi:hypothetical protein